MCSQQSKGAKYPQKSFNCADAFSIKITRFHAALKPIFRSLKPFQAFSSLLNLGARDFSFYMNTHIRHSSKNIDRSAGFLSSASPLLHHLITKTIYKKSAPSLQRDRLVRMKGLEPT